MPTTSAAIPITPLPRSSALSPLRASAHRCCLLFARALIGVVSSSRERSSVLSPLRASAHRCCLLFARALIGVVSSSRERSSVPNWFGVLHFSATSCGHGQRIADSDGGTDAVGHPEQLHPLKATAALERVLHCMRRANRHGHVRAGDRLVVDQNRATSLTDRHVGADAYP